MPVRAALESLQKAYFFDVAESGSKLKFITRGKNEAELIDAECIVPIKEKQLNITREHELVLPQKIEVNFISRAKNFQIGNQSSTREVTNSQGVESVSLPLVLNEWQARQLADIMIYNLWLARTKYEFALPIKYAYLEPGDVVEVSGHIIRITETLLGANGEMRIKGTAENNEVYDVYSPPEVPIHSNPVTEIAATELEILDIPAPDNEPMARFTACGIGANWQGCAVFRSDDGGVSYNQYNDILTEGTIGKTLNALASGGFGIFDEAATLDVSLINGELESVSVEALLNGANIAVVGDEIIQFKNAELIEEGKYRLSCLLRGRLGTEWAIGLHVAVERFVLLDNSVAAEIMPDYLIGLLRKYKGVSLGKTLESASVDDFIFKANSLKPYAPVHVAGVRDGSGNLTVSWVRRTRIGGDLRDNVDVPLSEEFEKYDIEIMNGSNVVRLVTATSPNFIYTNTQQIADFDSLQAAVNIKIYQLSAIVGRGSAASGVV